METPEALQKLPADETDASGVNSSLKQQRYHGAAPENTCVDQTSLFAREVFTSSQHVQRPHKNDCLPLAQLRVRDRAFIPVGSQPTMTFLLCQT